MSQETFEERAEAAFALAVANTTALAALSVWMEKQLGSANMGSTTLDIMRESLETVSRQHAGSLAQGILEQIFRPMLGSTG